MNDIKKIPLLVIGVAGASASGKSSLLKSMSLYLRKENVAHLDLDGYHMHTRAEREKLNEYPDEIRANDFSKIIQHIKALRSGRTIDMPIYNHRYGIFSSPVKLSPKPILFIEGLHAVMINDISDQKIIDLSIFLYPDEDLRKSWKVKRDVSERGYSYSDAIEQIAKRKPLVIKYILPQINITDIIISIRRTRNGFIRHRVLLSLAFYNRCLSDKFISEVLSKYFSIQEASFEGNRYAEIHLGDDTRLFDFLKGKVPHLKLETFQHNLLDRDSYEEIVEILVALILTMIGGR